MRKTNVKKTISLSGAFQSIAFRAALLLVLFSGIAPVVSAQETHEHDDDTLIALNRHDFTVSISNNNAVGFQLNITNNTVDTLTPFFTELHSIGFTFGNECILQQSINNLNLETNIEKLWGPQFVSTGISAIPPGGTYSMVLSTSSAGTEAMLKVRLFGSINGQNFIWVGFVKKQ